MSILRELESRGVVAQTTDVDKLEAALEVGLTFYVGFDPTAASLHHGHLMQLVTARRLQRAGHRAIVLIGGATGLIGDPRMTSERTLNSSDQVAEWADKLVNQVGKFLAFDGDNPAILVNNLDWTRELSAIDLLREIGKHFRVSKMLSKEAVAARLNSEVGISYTEFSYQLLQANDFRELNGRYGCSLQLGGSDQWGNITAGMDLVSKTSRRETHAIATQLMVKSDGTKFGKTEGGAIWLDSNMTSPFSFYQFWINLPDADVDRLSLAFSSTPLESLVKRIEQHQLRPANRALQHDLALEMTALVHGTEAATECKAASDAVFGVADLALLPVESLESAAVSLPNILETHNARRPLEQLLAELGLASSLTDSRRQAKQGAIHVNNRRVDDVSRPLSDADFIGGRVAVIRKGKRHVAAVISRNPESTSLNR